METTALDHIIELKNYRSTYPVDHIAGLADSMKRFGFKNEFAVTVVDTGALHIQDHNPVYALVKGHCRTRAAREAGLVSIPCHITTETDTRLLALDQLSENEARLDPNDIDRAKGYQAALDAGSTIEDLYAAIGKRQHTEFVERRLALLKLAGDIQDLVAKKHFPLMCAHAISVLDTNRQHIALQAYNKAKSPTLEVFREVVNKLYTEQVQESQTTLFALMSVEEISAKTLALAEQMSTEPRQSIQALIKENEALKKQRDIDRAYARSKYAQAQREIAELKAQLYQIGENAA